MTDEELEKKAKRYAETDNRNRVYAEDSVIDIQWQLEAAYISGAKENGVVWHDLRKNPDDLPSDSRSVLTTVGDRTYSNRYYEDGWVQYEAAPVIAWCEIPKFEEGK